MIWLVGMASALLSAYAVCVVGLEDSVLTIICRIVLVIAANIMLWFASNHYETLKSRIKALEDKLNEKEDTK